MANVDIKSAYWTVSVHPQDWWCWTCTQAMGRSFINGYNIAIQAKISIEIFTALVNAAEWIVRKRGASTT